jgi:hypothetical protein
MIIISPRIGLCNQLKTIANGILLGIKYNRNIYIDKFQVDLKSGELCEINIILDIEKINIFLKNILKTSIRILTTIDQGIIDNLHNYCLPDIDYKNIQNISYINDNIELNQTMEIIYLDNIVSLDIYKSFNFIYDDYSGDNLFTLIITNIQFDNAFYKIKDYVKQELNLTKFNSIHLRIEDDAINFFSMCYNLSIQDYNNKILSFYHDSIKILSKDKTYICSGMIDFDNTINNDYYTNLMKNNNLLCDKKNIIIDKFYLNNRELIAIIDLLIAYDSEIFVGSLISSFSSTISHYFKYNNKECILFQP